MPVIADFLQTVPHATVKEMSQELDLSTGQVHYALAPLREAALVTMEGTQGARTTTYRWSGDVLS